MLRCFLVQFVTVQSGYGPRAGWLLGLGPLDGPERREAEGPQWMMEVSVMVEVEVREEREGSGAHSLTRVRVH